MGNAGHSQSLPGSPNFKNHGPAVTYKQISKKRPVHHHHHQKQQQQPPKLVSSSIHFQVGQIKKKTPPEGLCKGMPEEFPAYLKVSLGPNANDIGTRHALEGEG